MEEIVRNAEDLLGGNRYPGRGILVGESADGRCACFAYFIMGRSENSRNRILKEQDGVLFTRAFDETLVKDPSLILYPAMRRRGDRIIVTNGDQTDTIDAGIASGVGFFEALASRTYEPDAPNYTPRISAQLSLDDDFRYEMSILRRGRDGACDRGEYAYLGQAGVGHLLHTYLHDGDPLPSFEGDPKPVRVPSDIDALATALWNALDEENKIALFVRYIDLSTGAQETRLFNKNTRSEK